MTREEGWHCDSRPIPVRGLVFVRTTRICLTLYIYCLTLTERGISISYQITYFRKRLQDDRYDVVTSTALGEELSIPGHV